MRILAISLLLIFVIAGASVIELEHSENWTTSLNHEIKAVQHNVESSLLQNAINTTQAPTQPHRAPPACSVAKAGCSVTDVLKHASLSLEHCEPAFEAKGPQCQDTHMYIHPQTGPQAGRHQTLAPHGNNIWNWAVIGSTDSKWTLHHAGGNKFTLETENPASPEQKYLSTKPAQNELKGRLRFTATSGPDELWILSTTNCQHNHCEITIVAAKNNSLSLAAVWSKRNGEARLISGKPQAWTIVSQLNHPACVGKPLPLKSRISQWLANYAQLLVEEVKLSSQQVKSIKAAVPQSIECSGWNGHGFSKPPAWKCGGLAWQSNQDRIHNLHRSHGYSTYADSATELEFAVGDTTWICKLMKVGTSLGFICQNGIKPTVFCKANIGELVQEKQIVPMPTGIGSFKNLSTVTSQKFSVTTHPMFKQVNCDNHDSCGVEKVTFLASHSSHESANAQDEAAALMKWF